MKCEGAKGCGGPVWRWREDLSQFATMEKLLHAHNTSRLAASDRGDQREGWYGSLQSEWAIHAGGRVKGDYSRCYHISAYHQ